MYHSNEYFEINVNCNNNKHSNSSVCNFFLHKHTKIAHLKLHVLKTPFFFHTLSANKSKHTKTHMHTFYHFQIDELEFDEFLILLFLLLENFEYLLNLRQFYPIASNLPSHLPILSSPSYPPRKVCACLYTLYFFLYVLSSINCVILCKILQFCNLNER